MKIEFADVCDGVAITVLGLLVLFAMWLMFVWLPISAVNQADCLRAGYPESRVTFNFERYCLTLDGAVTVKVEAVK